jgi:hypothetical protein
VPKVHNKPIKRPRKGFKQESKRQPERHLGLAHRTVRCSRALEAELFTFGNFQGRSAIIHDCPVSHQTVSGEHRTVRCVSGATSTSRATVDCNALNARLRAQRSEHAQLLHRTVYRTCPVHHRTAQSPHKSELQRSKPNGLLTWLAHRTVRCAMRLQPSNDHFLVVGAINTPTTPHSMVSKFPLFYTLQELAFNTRHTKEIKSSPNSTQSFSD